MKLIIDTMTKNYAEEILNWQYEAPYEVYSLSYSEEGLEEFLNGYTAVLDGDCLIGYYCTGKSAQVPPHNYERGYLDVGLGMKPELTGNGFGKLFLAFILAQFGTIPLRLTVAIFNKRAVRLYEDFGFKEKSTFKRGDQTFMVMVRKERSHPDSVIVNTRGQNNDVLIVNNRFIYRFPKSETGVTALKKETEILKKILPYVTLKTPRPISNSRFMAYERIAGEPLLVLPDGVEQVAKQLGGFLWELHQIPVSIFEDQRPEVALEMKNLYEQFQEHLYPLMRADAKIEVSENFERYLSDPKHFDFEPCLIHGDFGKGNILSNGKSVTGIIDFGSSRLGDPAYDFAGLYSSYGEKFLERLSAYYPGLEAVRERMDFYRSTFALQEALLGVLHSDEEALKAGMADYV